MTSATALEGRPTGFFQRLYALACDEVREGRARRGLPFGGLFAPVQGPSA